MSCAPELKFVTKTLGTYLLDHIASKKLLITFSMKDLDMLEKIFYKSGYYVAVGIHNF